MKAIPYGEGKFDGDSEFYAPDDAVEYSSKDSFEDLVAKVDAIRYEGEHPEDRVGEPIRGFWLLNDEDVETVKSRVRA